MKGDTSWQQMDVSNSVVGEPLYNANIQAVIVHAWTKPEDKKPTIWWNMDNGAGPQRSVFANPTPNAGMGCGGFITFTGAGGMNATNTIAPPTLNPQNSLANRLGINSAANAPAFSGNTQALDTLFTRLGQRIFCS